MASTTFPSSIAECKQEVQFALHAYYFVLLASVLFTIFAMIMYYACLKQLLDGAPALAAQYFFAVGSLKILFAVLIAIGFQPLHCPSHCHCSIGPGSTTANHFSVILPPLVVSLVGFRWIYEGYVKVLRARSFHTEGIVEDADGPIFTPVATNDEIELT